MQGKPAAQARLLPVKRRGPDRGTWRDPRRRTLPGGYVQSSLLSLPGRESIWSVSTVADGPWFRSRLFSAWISGLDIPDAISASHAGRSGAVASRKQKEAQTLEVPAKRLLLLIW